MHDDVSFSGGRRVRPGPPDSRALLKLGGSIIIFLGSAASGGGRPLPLQLTSLPSTQSRSLLVPDRYRPTPPGPLTHWKGRLGLCRLFRHGGFVGCRLFLCGQFLLLFVLAKVLRKGLRRHLAGADCVGRELDVGLLRRRLLGLGRFGRSLSGRHWGQFD